MTFGNAISSCFDNYANFNGRAPRSEYWWFNLFLYIMSALTYGVCMLIGQAVGGLYGMLVSVCVGMGLYSIILFLPSLAVLVRRLHDTGRSGWWFFITFIPFVGSIWIFILTLLGSDEENKYGLPVY